MKYLLPVVCLSFSLAGCYTMIYPPPSDTLYGINRSDSVLTLPDSIAGRGVTIINQNQIIFDRYYQDPFYYRGGLYGGYGGWDPYYYNPYGYRHDQRWHRGWIYPGGTPGPVTPPPKKPRREKDYRGEEASPDDSPNPTGLANADNSSSLSSPPKSEPNRQDPPVPVRIAESPPVKPDSAKSEASKPEERVRSVKSVKPPDPPENKTQPDTSQDKKEDKKPRRGNTRER
ncbi:MAG: hypothetical protein V2A61_01960 [Calditrichota bacterium]